MEKGFSGEEMKYLRADEFRKQSREKENKIIEHFEGEAKDVLLDIMQFPQPVEIMGTKLEEAQEKYSSQFADRVAAFTEADQERIIDAMESLYEVFKERWQYEGTNLYWPALKPVTVEDIQRQSGPMNPSEVDFTGGWLLPHVIKKSGRTIQEWEGPSARGRKYRHVE